MKYKKNVTETVVKRLFWAFASHTRPIYPLINYPGLHDQLLLRFYDRNLYPAEVAGRTRCFFRFRSAVAAHLVLRLVDVERMAFYHQKHCHCSPYLCCLNQTETKKIVKIKSGKKPTNTPQYDSRVVEYPKKVFNKCQATLEF